MPFSDDVELCFPDSPEAASDSPVEDEKGRVANLPQCFAQSCEGKGTDWYDIVVFDIDARHNINAIRGHFTKHFVRESIALRLSYCYILGIVSKLVNARGASSTQPRQEQGVVILHDAGQKVGC